MEFLKGVISDDLYKQLIEALKDKKEIKLGNLAGGAYVGKDKFDAQKTELDGIKAQLSEANKQIEAFKGMNIDGIKKAADEYKTKFEEAEKNHKDELNKIAYNSAADKFIDSLKPKDGLSKKAILSEFKTKEFKLEGNMFQGAKEWAEKFKKDNASHFSDDTTVKVDSGNTHGNPLGTDIDGFIANARKAAGLDKTK